MAYFAPYQAMIYGVFTIPTLAAAYPPSLEIAGRYAYCSDAPGDGIMQCDGVNWFSPTTSTVATPVARTLALGTAYQAINPTLASVQVINLTSTTSISLLSTTQASQKMDVYMAATAGGVTGGTGTKIAAYENTQTGTLVVTLVLGQVVNQQILVPLPAGWYFGVLRTSGTVNSILSAFEMVIS